MDKRLIVARDAEGNAVDLYQVDDMRQARAMAKLWRAQGWTVAFE